MVQVKTADPDEAWKIGRRGSGWVFLSSHAQVLLALAEDPDRRLRDVGDALGLTERAVADIVADLERAGYLTRSRQGRRNRYTFHPQTPMRHPMVSHNAVENLLNLLRTPDGEALESGTGHVPRP